MTTSLVDPKSLACTLNNITLAHLKGQPLAKAEREEAAAWIASRIGQDGTYRGLAAPTGQDYRTKLQLFTGELVGSRAGTGCKLGFEATWALTVLRPTEAMARKAAKQCQEQVVGMFTAEHRPGIYCCGSCSPAC